MHHHDPAGAISVRMGVLFGWPAVRGPAGVADAIGAMQRMLPDHLFQVAQFPWSAAQFQPMSGGPYSNTGRVVSAILQPSQAFKNDRDDVLRTDITHNSAHSPLLYGWYVLSRTGLLTLPG